VCPTRKLIISKLDRRGKRGKDSAKSTPPPTRGGDISIAIEISIITFLAEEKILLCGETKRGGEEKRLPEPSGARRRGG